MDLSARVFRFRSGLVVAVLFRASFFFFLVSAGFLEFVFGGGRDVERVADACRFFEGLDLERVYGRLCLWVFG